MEIYCGISNTQNKTLFCVTKSYVWQYRKQTDYSAYSISPLSYIHLWLRVSACTRLQQWLLRYVKYVLKYQTAGKVCWRTAIMKFHHFSKGTHDYYPLVLLHGYAPELIDNWKWWTLFKCLGQSNDIKFLMHSNRSTEGLHSHNKKVMKTCIQFRIHIFPKFVYLNGSLYFFIYFNCESVFTRWQWYYNKTKTKTKTPWFESASELYRPSDSRLSAKWLRTFADRGCHTNNISHKITLNAQTEQAYKITQTIKDTLHIMNIMQT
jgi:hypothetical protein